MTESVSLLQDRLNEKVQQISGPTFDLPVNENKEPKKFTNKCRLFVGNLTDDTTMDEFQEMFSVFGEIAEPYINLEKAFGFVKLVGGDTLLYAMLCD